MRGTRAGRQCNSGSSLGFRDFKIASAQGVMEGDSPLIVFGANQTPVRSGLPSAAWGVGPDGGGTASRSPSGPINIPPPGPPLGPAFAGWAFASDLPWFADWAAAGVGTKCETTTIAPAVTSRLMKYFLKANLRSTLRLAM